MMLDVVEHYAAPGDVLEVLHRTGSILRRVTAAAERRALVELVRPGNEKVADGIFGGPNGDFGNYNMGNLTQIEINKPRQRQTGE